MTTTFQFTDTHTHLYDERFTDDQDDMIQRSIDSGVTKMYLPNCDSETIAPMMRLASKWPQHCFPMMGVHPCYIKENYRDELAIAASWLEREKFAAVGEIGLDYYWDTTFTAQQKEAFNIQMDWALQYNLPIVIHTRESMADGIAMVKAKQNGNLRGVFHCFGGSVEEARQIIDLGFYLGIGGVATYKKSDLPETLQHISLEHIVLETDAPYLAPVPHRGRRNESAYIPIIGTTIASIKNCSLEEVATATTKNAEALFGR
jgi:TatD DNase family protein